MKRCLRTVFYGWVASLALLATEAVAADAAKPRAAARLVPHLDRRAFIRATVGLLALAPARFVHAAEGGQAARGIIIEHYEPRQRVVQKYQFESTELGFGRDRPLRLSAVDLRSRNFSLRPILEHDPACIGRSVALSPDGVFVAATGTFRRITWFMDIERRNGYNEIRVTNLRTGNTVRQRTAFNQPSDELLFRRLAWRPDGKELALSIEGYHPPPDSFQPWRDNAYSLWTFPFDPAQTTIGARVSTHHYSWAPTFSPDSTHMVTAPSHYSETHNLVKITPDGRQQLLTKGLVARWPVWSPAAAPVEQIVFHGCKDTGEKFNRHLGPKTTYGLWRIKPDGSGVKELLPNAFDHVIDGPIVSWSPNGRQVATTVARHLPLPRGTGEALQRRLAVPPLDVDLLVKVIDPNSGQVRDIGKEHTFRGRDEDSVVWSPDSRRIAFVAAATAESPESLSPQRNLVIADVETNTIRRLAIPGIFRPVAWY